MTNKRRGEVSLILDGKPYSLCLTLAALAELEASLGLDNIGALADRFSDGRVKSSDLVKILGSALRAGGVDISDEVAAKMRCQGGASALTAALVALLCETFVPELDDASKASGDAVKGRFTSNPTMADLA